MNVAIIAAKRTPIGGFLKTLAQVPAPQLGAAALRACYDSLGDQAQHTLQNTHLCALGCVLMAGLGQAPARQAMRLAQLPDNIPAQTLNKMCGSGLQTIMDASMIIQGGFYTVVAAGGMENMSRAPYLLQGARTGYKYGPKTVDDHLVLDGLEDAYDDHKLMGWHAEMCAEKHKLSRQMQDDFSLASFEKAREACQKGYFAEEIVPVLAHQKEEPFAQDEPPFSVDLKKFPHLKAAFKENGTITAGNASSLADGAASVLLAPESWAVDQGIKPLALIRGSLAVGTLPGLFPEAPVLAIPSLLKRLDWTLDSVDLFEINEAFAIVPLLAMQALNIPAHKVNIHGGACALGHPLGASGARILVTLIHALRKRGGGRGIATLCVGGGEAVAMGIEALS